MPAHAPHSPAPWSSPALDGHLCRLQAPHPPEKEGGPAEGHDVEEEHAQLQRDKLVVDERHQGPQAPAVLLDREEVGGECGAGVCPGPALKHQGGVGHEHQGAGGAIDELVHAGLAHHCGGVGLAAEEPLHHFLWGWGLAGAGWGTGGGSGGGGVHCRCCGWCSHGCDAMAGLSWP
jgi:hypothetical protein